MDQKTTNIISVHSIQSNVFKFSILAKNIPVAHFTEKEKTILKFIWYQKKKKKDSE